ncbi:type II toxin-antitoxin system VapB family antitoxin [Rhizobium sp. OAE497]|uniref:type II toxin-antitoxin system VapB family antitoxin n=1 Tax=Rhizobium sp. OAE497 TaxID=2663796 RepID=UPI0018F61A53
MALYIRDPEVDEMATELQRLTNAATKTDTVKAALQHELVRARRKVPVHTRLEHAKSLADAMGSNDPAFDLKKFSDEMWGD